MIFSELSQIINGKTLLLSSPSQEITDLVIDSRNNAKGTDDTLFFAIKGANHDGHKYVTELYAKGVRNFVVKQSIDISDMPEANVLQVGNSIEALQKVAHHHRSQFDLPIIGITGSNGKTIVKEWLASMLSIHQSIVKSPRSYNSQIGVPLSVWQITPEHQIGLFEAGISQVGEMARLESVVRPTIGIFTNIGSAHDEGFGNRTIKIQEKLKLFKSVDKLIYCKDHEDIHHAIEQSSIPSFSWSLKGAADIKAHVNQTELSVQYSEIMFNLPLRHSDSASIENLMHCVATMLHLGYSQDQIQQSATLQPEVKMRLELKQGISGCQIIDDTYNNDLAGLEVALNFLSQQSSLSKAVILSDILQAGISGKELYFQVAQLIEKNEIKRIIGVGEQFFKYQSLFDSAVIFKTTDELLDHLSEYSFDKEAILIKGARAFQFEKITARLTQKIHGTSLEINLNALTHNLNFYRGKLHPDTKLMVMVKALAYGSGSNEIAHLLAHHKVDYLGVAYVDEGVVLRENGIRTPTMVMNPTEDGFDNILKHGLEPEIYNPYILEQLISFLDGERLGIHLKIDSGMRRLGFQESELQELTALLRQHSNIEVKSVFTHLAGSDEAQHNEFSKIQVDKFERAYDYISSELSITPLKHVVNSPGIIRFPEYHFDMVRLGIGLYGIETTNIYQDQLLSISSLKTIVSQINHVKAGETIGYSRKGIASNDMTIATIAIGYADGFSRAFSNGLGEVIINGKSVSVIGNVCMDMTMVDVSDIDVSIGDEVIIFGEHLPITILAEKLNTIPYEILTNVSSRVKRVYYLD